ncbi:MAG: MBL fold metallo-hydrolase [Acidobacteria bacterium]|nr:MBL fold metallo-hydrolase [Acidobacteriota bacterium]
MQNIAPKTTLIDVEYFGHPQVIAPCLLEADGAVAIMDPGPTSAVATLKNKLNQLGLGVTGIDTILLTHIHLDHAGATGTLVRENPRIRVYVHEGGAPHMSDPARLLKSARRLYGTEMNRLWGEFVPVPAANVCALEGGERLNLGGRELEVAYTPGHAFHHVSYFDTVTGLAFVGDTAGLRIANGQTILPLTPPPDIDLESWPKSWQQIQAWQPERLFLTHFGPAVRPEEHLAELRERLEGWSVAVRESLKNGKHDAECAAQFAEQETTRLKRHLSERDAIRLARGAALEICWYGLARYWRKRGAA